MNNGKWIGKLERNLNLNLTGKFHFLEIAFNYNNTFINFVNEQQKTD